MARPAARALTVTHITDITPNMRRITFGGAGIKSIPPKQESAHLKFMFPQIGQSRPAKRSYTILNQRKNEIDVDFVLHAPNHKGLEGPASQWVKTVQLGDDILVAGPGATKLIEPHADWYLLAGDMTALPSISVNLARLPKNATGYAIIEVRSEDDIQTLDKPKHIDLHWVIVGHASANRAPLLDKIKTLDWLTGTPDIWVACEFNSMRALRQYFKQYDISKRDMYISSYWKIDSSDDEHRLAKRHDEMTK